MIKLTIDGVEVEVDPGLSLIQACEIAGIEIPRFCYHDRLSIAGNCRMCLVEVEKSPKPVASCAMPVSDGMIVRTNSQLVKEAREGVMEFLLINHPLDCPICDQGGECDLQDQAMAYGLGNSRYDEQKRAVQEKHMGPLVKTNMTRCIHCTRCVRFISEVAGTYELGAIYRGENMEITTILDTVLTSELSGNIIDLCPVGALTSKPYAFKARSWELSKTESIDVLDALGSNIRIDTRGKEVMRILPRLNEGINEEWISDKTRFSYDGLKYQRIDVPMLKINGKFIQTAWEDALNIIHNKINSSKINAVGALAGNMTDLETMIVMKDLLQSIGSSNMDARQDNMYINNKTRSGYIFNSGISGIEEADFLLIVGANPRYDSPVLNSRIRKSVINNNLPVNVIGNNYDLTYDVEYLGEDISILNEIESGEHEITKKMINSKKPMIIIGSDVLTDIDAEYIVEKILIIANKVGVIKKEESWNGFNILHRFASRVGSIDIGFMPKNNENFTFNNMDVLFLLGADEFDVNKISKDTFVVYIGHHGEIGAMAADIVLPGCAYTEKNATYVNLEGRVQRTMRAVYAPLEAKEDWEIVNMIASRVSNINYKDLTSVRSRIEEEFKYFADINMIYRDDLKIPQNNFKLSKKSLNNSYNCNYFLTDVISRHSKTLLECAKIYAEKVA